jgi:hypothetical protein
MQFLENVNQVSVRHFRMIVTTLLVADRFCMDKGQEAFEGLKQAFITGPILAHEGDLG